MKYLTLIGLVMICISCTQKPSERISHPQDLAQFITAPKPEPILAALDSEIVFWENKLKAQPAGFLYQQKLGAALAAQFENTGDINYIHQSNAYLKNATSRTSGQSKASTLLSLSSNAVKLHRFKDALDYAFEASNHTSEDFGPKMMQYDALMEVGRYDEAIYTLRSTRRQESFAYQVRYAKYQDHIGQLDSAIYYMESALEKVKPTDMENWLWTKASLGDYYGHSGDVKKSYDTFLEVLNKDPKYRHALQGIAWIAYSYDRDPTMALQIYEYLNDLSDMPDQLLAMAEVYDFMNNDKETERLTAEFVARAEDPKFGDMYSMYLIDYYVDKDISKAITLANKEVANRPTPQSYAALAWSLYHDGQVDESLNLIEKYVTSKTHEPELVRKSAVIAAAAGDEQLASQLLEDIADARFELGPLAVLK